MHQGHRAVMAALIASAIGTGCGDNEDGDERQGGDTTLDQRDREAFNHSAANLPMDLAPRYQNGKSTFGFHWMPPKLGNLFNNDACSGCHAANGRGLPVTGTGAMPSQGLVRVSLLDGAPGDPGGPIPVPGFGTQLQDHAVVGLPEVNVVMTWLESGVPYADGEIAGLREPHFGVHKPDGGSLPGSTRMSFRIGPPLIGLGLLEAVPEATLRKLADPDDADGDGISGRVNEVWDPELQATVIGRFGWKANTSSIHVQVAAAFVNDIGVSNLVFPEDGGFRDLNDMQLADTTFFTSTTAVPVADTSDPDAFTGRGLFRDFGCAGCHVPTLETGDHPIDALAHQRIHPYTDLLVHDMGDRLSDGRPDFLAEGTEWRTPPLWGIGLTQTINPMATFLHDGRARTFEEAILWHGGEAEAAKEAFRTATRSDRAALIAFLSSL